MNALMLVLTAAGLAQLAVPVEEVTLERPEVILHGSLYSPTDARELVIVHAGSGPTDRHGNQRAMKNDSLKRLAEGLAEQGVAVLGVDKRGVGQSRMEIDEQSLRPSVFIDDLVAWVEWAGERNPDWRIHLLGHSEGALFAKVAATRTEVSSVISLAGAGRPAGVFLREQTAGRLPGDLGLEFERVLASLEAGEEVAEVSPMLNVLVRPSIQPYLIEWLALDPVAVAAELDVPLLVIAGSTDIQVKRADFDALAAQAARSEWVEGMNHVLKAVEGPLSAQLPSYSNPDLPLHEDLMPALIGWIDSLDSRQSGKVGHPVGQ